MKHKILSAVILGSAALLATVGANAGSSTYYNKVTVTAETGKGRVYVSDKADAPADDAYTETMTSTFSGTSDKQDIYLFAKPAEGLSLVGWIDQSGKLIQSNYVTLSGSTDQDAPTVASYTAKFGHTVFKVESSDPTLGTVETSNLEPAKGDIVTLTAKFVVNRTGKVNATRSNNIAFDGWFNSKGECLSTDMVYNMPFDGNSDVVTGRFRWRKMFTGPGYYRVRRGINDTRGYMTVKGDFKPMIGTGSDERWCDGYLELTNSRNNPGNILYIDGRYTEMDQLKPETEVMKDVVIYGQGTNTADVMGGMKMKLKTAYNNGFYKLIFNSYAVACTFHQTQELGSDGRGQLLYLTNDWGSLKQDQDVAAYYDLEPINEEYVDEFYFSAAPDERMAYDGGYWTTMYTAFPYQCYEPDGVEAYIIDDVKIGTGNEANVVYYSRVPDGIVPANCAVLLKCPVAVGQTATDLRNIAPVNRLIPLMTDDARIDNTIAERNRLNGVFQLNDTVQSPYRQWTNSTKPYPDKPATFETAHPGHVRYSPETMRVFSINTAGDLGFYKLPSATVSGEEVDDYLLPNRAYLDIEALGLNNGKPIRMAVRTGASTGIENIIAPEGDAIGGDNVIYDLYGRRVDNPVPGTIYIIGGKKTLYR